VAVGQLVVVTVSGQIDLGDAPPSGPGGSDFYGFDDDDKPPFGYSHGIVILKIGENHFAIEDGMRALAAPHSGALSLYVNDDLPSDNSGSFAVSVSLGPTLVGDADEDTLPDTLEDTLLEQYAPEIRFDTDENVRPADVYWFLRNVDLLVDGDEDSTKILNRKQTPYFPEWFLTQFSDDSPPRPTNYLDSPFEVLTYSNIRNSHRSGPDWERVTAAGNLGIYGHVVPDAYPSSGAIIVQYWMFYPWNDADAPFHAFDHEGDWELYEVFLDPIDPTDITKMQSAVWHGHGEPFTAKWEAVCAEGIDCWTWINPPVGCSAPDYSCLPVMPQGHAPIFVEAGTHGSWPYNVDSFGVGKNRGNSLNNYVATGVTNLGEAYRPRLGAEVVLQFNGRWGAFKCCGSDVTTPPGPTLHGQWRPSPGANDEARYVGGWSHGQQHPNGLAPSGRISWPHVTVGEAVQAATSNQTVLVFPGNYPELLTLHTPMTIKAPYGGVVIGAQ
jgi:hypothetical protein